MAEKPAARVGASSLPAALRSTCTATSASRSASPSPRVSV